MWSVFHDRFPVNVHATKKGDSDPLVKHTRLWPSIVVLSSVVLWQLPSANTNDPVTGRGVNSNEALIGRRMDASRPHIDDEVVVLLALRTEVLPECLVKRVEEHVTHSLDIRRYGWTDDNGRRFGSFMCHCSSDKGFEGANDPLEDERS